MSWEQVSHFEIAGDEKISRHLVPHEKGPLAAHLPRETANLTCSLNVGFPRITQLRSG